MVDMKQKTHHLTDNIEFSNKMSQNALKRAEIAEKKANQLEDEVYELKHELRKQ